MTLFLAISGLILAAIPAAMFMANLPLFQSRFLETDLEPEDQCISVLVPARDEESSIERCVAAALASESVDVQVVILDDHSTDATSQIVQRLQSNDDRVSYLQGKDLPDGWNGKQFACKQLADAALHDQFVFIDADVRLKPHALRELLVRKSTTNVALLSAFPHQETGTILEKWLIPMMHFILLGYLPFQRMRGSDHPSYASGCGQLFLTNRDDYVTAGTHAAIAQSRHDGLKLPRAYRSKGLMTDVIDGTDLAECRMYNSAGQVIRGVMKNADEAIASPRLIVPFSILLFGSSVLPLAMLLVGFKAGEPIVVLIALLGILLGHLPRAIAAVRFRQSWLGVLCHSPATTLFVALQWIALAMSIAGRKVRWRGRS